MYATIEEAWGISKFSKPLAPPPTAKPPAAPVAAAPASLDNAPEAADAAKVRDFIARVYSSSGVGGLLSLLSPSMVEGLKSTKKAPAGGGVWSWWSSFVRDPEKLLMLVTALFVIVVLCELGRGGSPAPTGLFPAPLAW